LIFSGAGFGGGFSGGLITGVREAFGGGVSMISVSPVGGGLKTLGSSVGVGAGGFAFGSGVAVGGGLQAEGEVAGSQPGGVDAAHAALPIAMAMTAALTRTRMAHLLLVTRPHYALICAECG
jgi:hypothetical protein